FADRQRILEVRVRPRDDVDGDQLADAARGGGAGVGRGLHRGDVAAHDRGHIARADLFPAHEGHLGGLDHGIGRLAHRDAPFGLDHPERFTHLCSLLQASSWKPYFNSLTAASMSADSSRYVSRISPSLPAESRASGTRRSPADSGASTV